MATFHIHQDSEKENSHFSLKEKSVLGNTTRTVLQPVASAAALKEKLSGIAGVVGGVGGGGVPNALRTNFGVINSSNNANQARVVLGGGVGGVSNKAGFREVGKAKVNDENAGCFAAAAGNKKLVSGTVVPVEQFKTFSVYEDHSEKLQQHIDGKTLKVSNVLEKENCYVEQRIQVVSKGLHPDDSFALDTTPMSVSDVLSPMSVDRSQLNSAMKLLDDSNCKSSKKCDADDDGMSKNALPRNDRQRFFEVVEYQQSILEYFRESEKKHRPKPHYMRRQADINYSMRTILVDWLVEVSEEYNLDTETLYLSVSYIDRFLSHMSVVRNKLQLVGTAAMYIASKYEEIYPPDVGEFVFITDDTYNKAQVLRMEQIILKILSFDLCTPTAYVFINTYAVLADIPDKLKFLAQYMCELSLLEADPYLRFHPSLVSAASMALARHNLTQCIWSAELEEITTYRLEDLREVIVHLSRTHVAAETLAQQAIQEKYNAEKYRQVAKIKALDLSEAAFDELTAKYNEMQLAAKNNAADSTSSTKTITASSNENVRRMISAMFN